MKNTLTNIHDLGLLFEKVQIENIFPDNKTFPDCTPKYNLDEINAKFLLEKDTDFFDLKSFILEHFDLPINKTATYKTDKNHSVEQHLHALWEVLTREPDQQQSSLIPLPKPYIVPGGRFGEVYYWDSYFTILGLQASGKVAMIEAMVDNFSYLLTTIGHIPNGNRTYYVGRSQPPFYALMVKVLSEEKDLQTLVDYLPYLAKEYQFWMSGSEQLTEQNNAISRVVLLPDGAILNRYWDENSTPRPESYREDTELAHASTQSPEVLHRHLRAAAESGWDFSSRWFQETDDFKSIHTTDIIPVDLNCLLLNLEETLSAAYSLVKDEKVAKKYEILANKRKKNIQTYCWNKAQGFYFDYDFVQNIPKTYLTLAGVFPLFFKVASKLQAKKVAMTLSEKFLQSGGFVTTLARTGQQWDAPNGWAPLQWIVYKGLLNYGFGELANEGKSAWLNLNREVFEQTGKMTEKYNVMDGNITAGGGEYANQDGFGWTNGVFLAMMRLEVG